MCAKIHAAVITCFSTLLYNLFLERCQCQILVMHRRLKYSCVCPSVIPSETPTRKVGTQPHHLHVLLSPTQILQLLQKKFSKSIYGLSQAFHFH